LIHSTFCADVSRNGEVNDSLVTLNSSIPPLYATEAGFFAIQLQYTEPEAGALTLGSISNEAAAGIKKMTGFNTTGFETVIEQDTVKQIINEHGKTGTIDHSMMDINDIARMQYVIDNYDTVIKSSVTKQTPISPALLSSSSDSTHFSETSVANNGQKLANESSQGYNGNKVYTEPNEGAGDFEPDIEIGKSLGAQAKNYDIVAPNGETFKLTEGSRITDVKVIAGDGRDRKIDIVDKLVGEYGGNPLKWKKCKGYGYIDVNGEDFFAELHWYEEPSVGRVVFKIKRQPGGNWFINEN
jgi:hypothetical protein